MSQEPEKEFEKNMAQLLKLLKKLMASSFKNEGPVKDFPMGTKTGQGININFCFLSFFPMSPEELDDLEDLYEQYLSQEDKTGGEFSSDLTDSDLDFLKKNGIRF
ncbi:MAG: hypothetical protein H6757_05975 [Candidatus Omnitrophica bacterium]|nr:hypothetical protein [Candidatus Omnitrophota bacterium]